MTSEDLLGISADELLRLPGRGKACFVRQPKVLETEREGDPPDLVVAWFYRDCTVEHRRRDRGGVSAYRVVAVRPPEGGR